MIQASSLTRGTCVMIRKTWKINLFLVFVLTVNLIAQNDIYSKEAGRSMIFRSLCFSVKTAQAKKHSCDIILRTARKRGTRITAGSKPG